MQSLTSESKECGGEGGRRGRRKLQTWDKGKGGRVPPPGSGKRWNSARQPTCSAQVTPAMPPPTTTNFPIVEGGRAASMLSDS